MTQNVTLGDRIEVSNVGTGWIAVHMGERVEIEFVDETNDPITVPTRHLSSPLYEVTGEELVMDAVTADD